jgi:hypothetical protein
MFGWFRKFIRKIGIPGVLEVEFNPPAANAANESTVSKRRIHRIELKGQWLGNKEE